MEQEFNLNELNASTNSTLDYIDHYAWITLKTYLPVKRIGNKFLVLPGDNNGYGCLAEASK